MEKERANWGSRIGFILAAAGFSVGLGNIWRFPYMTGMNGGGAFLIVYLAISLIIGVPLFLSEVGLGRKTQLNPIAGMRKLTKKGSPWVAAGWLGTLASVFVMSYYLQVIGWMVAYFFKVISGTFKGMEAEQLDAAYASFTANTPVVMAFTLIVAIILGVIVTRGLKEGVEKACKIMMPTLFIFLLLLGIRSLTLPNAIEGVKWYLTPDFSKINAGVLVASLGQVFFSIGIGAACAFTYGSYLHPTQSDLPKDLAIVIFLDMLVAVIAGFVIFPALFSFGMEPDAGAGLLFVTMTRMFGELPVGNLLGGMFFFLIVMAGLTSGMGYLETVSNTMSELYNIDRKKSVWGTLAVMFLLGIPAILSQGSWSHVLILGMNFFDFYDYLSGNVLMTASGLMIILYTAFVWKFENYKEQNNIGATTIKIGNWQKILVTIIGPIAVAYITISAIIKPFLH